MDTIYIAESKTNGNGLTFLAVTSREARTAAPFKGHHRSVGYLVCGPHESPVTDTRMASARLSNPKCGHSPLMHTTIRSSENLSGVWAACRFWDASPWIQSPRLFWTCGLAFQPVHHGAQDAEQGNGINLTTLAEHHGFSGYFNPYLAFPIL